MYKIFADDTLIYDSTLEDYKIAKGEITREIGKAGSFIFSMYADNPFYDSILKMRTVITVYRDAEIIFRGRVLKAEDSFTNCRVFTCEGELNFLLDSIIRPYSFAGSPENLLRRFIEEHNSQVDDSKRFTLGVVSIIDGNNYVSRSNSEYEDALTNITEHLLNSGLGGYLFITHDKNGNSILNYYADFHDTASQAIEFGENLKDYTKVTNAEDITTVLIPLGAKLENSDERLTISSVNGGLDYIEDVDAVATYGRIVKTYVWDDVTDASNLLTKCRVKLKELILQNTTIELDAVDLHLLDRSIESYGYGMYVPVKSPPHNLDISMLCKRQTINLLKPDNDSLTLGYSYSSFTESVTNEKRTVADEKKETSTSISNIYKALNSKTGMYHTDVTAEDGSAVHYIHDQLTLEASTIVWKMTIDSIAVSNDGGKTYTNGITADGDAIFNIIKARKITTDCLSTEIINGFVTFTNLNTALSTKGKTTINGANITTGTISADRIDTDSMHVRKIYGQKLTDYEDIAIISSSGRNIAIGNGGTSGLSTNITVWGNNISFVSKNSDKSSRHLVINPCDTEMPIDNISYKYPCCIYPYNQNPSSINWTIGNEDYPFDSIYLDAGVYLWDSSNDGWSRLYVKSGRLKWDDATGDTVNLT
jgi:phage minor structural protein